MSIAMCATAARLIVSRLAKIPSITLKFERRPGRNKFRPLGFPQVRESGFSRGFREVESDGRWLWERCPNSFPGGFVVFNILLWFAVD